MTDIQKREHITSVIERPPPSYDEAQRTIYLPSTPIPTSSEQFLIPTTNPSSNFKPIVIPQVSKYFRGAFFSPFSRAYSPTLSTSSITPQEFLTFIDGLNEAFIAAPAFQIASYLGGAMTMVPFHPVMFAGMGLQVGAGLPSTATSWTRARAFVQTANEEIFQPKGLKVKVLKTKKMMVAVGHGGEVLNLPPLEIDSSSSPPGNRVALEGDERNDPRMRRIRALGDKIAPLTFEGLLEPETMENWWKRMGQKGAIRKDRKMHEKLMKERAKGMDKLDKKTRKGEKKGRKADREIREIEREQIREQEKAERKLESRKAQDPEERVKIERDFEREMRKLDLDLEDAIKEKEEKVGKKTAKGQEKFSKADEKEQKIAQKIYWIVIDKAEVLDQEVGNDDVESLESK